ncbi:MAG: prephenate dehydrogenase/arogenate dehydrogenase family protein [Candidatus Omnitrophota bacterium]
MKRFEKVAIIGVGLLGGSLGLAIKEKKLARRVVGYFRHKEKIKTAVRRGVIDEGTDHFSSAVSGADFIILCTPIYDIIGKLKQLKRSKQNKILITDVGSTKAEIVKAARGLSFVGSHPLAGSEQSGIAFAKSDLFKATLCLLTPCASTPSRSTKRVAQFWRRLGAKVSFMDAEKHDRIVACVSHLPHAIAFSLTNGVPTDMTRFAARAFKDMTRIAVSPVNVWMDIFLSNKKQTLKSMAEFEKSFLTLKAALAHNDIRALSSFLKRAGNIRRRIPINSCCA